MRKALFAIVLTALLNGCYTQLLLEEAPLPAPAISYQVDSLTGDSIKVVQKTDTIVIRDNPNGYWVRNGYGMLEFHYSNSYYPDSWYRYYDYPWWQNRGIYGGYYGHPYGYGGRYSRPFYRPGYFRDPGHAGGGGGGTPAAGNGKQRRNSSSGVTPGPVAPFTGKATETTSDQTPRRTTTAESPAKKGFITPALSVPLPPAAENPAGQPDPQPAAPADKSDYQTPPSPPEQAAPAPARRDASSGTSPGGSTGRRTPPTRNW